MKALGALNVWMFGFGSPVAMGAFRIVFGTVAFINFLMIAVDFDAWFGENGYVPWVVADRWLGNQPRLNLLAGVTDTRITAVFYGLVTLAALTTTLGLWTRLSTVALAVGTITLHHRNPLILHGGDTLLRMGVVLLALAPCGAACSLDRLIAQRRGTAPPSPPLVSLWPQRLMQIQLAIVYITTVWYKWFGNLWRDGTATWYPSQLTEFDRFPVPDFIYKPPFVQVTTYGTLMTELALGTLVFYRPLRRYVLIAGLALHGFIEYSMNIPLFGFVICAFYIAHYEGDEVAAWWHTRRLRDRVLAWRLKHGLTPRGERTPAAVETEEREHARRT